MKELLIVLFALSVSGCAQKPSEKIGLDEYPEAAEIYDEIYEEVEDAILDSLF